MSGLQSLIGQLGIFMICAQAIMHFRPKKAYEKYMKLLLSLMILLQAIQPLYSFFQKEESIELQVSLEYFQEQLDESMLEAGRQAAETEEILKQMSLEEVQERMEQTGQIEQNRLIEQSGLTGLQQHDAENVGNDKVIEIEQVQQIQVELGEAEQEKAEQRETKQREAEQSEVAP